jgi:putative sterol carrier protein
VGAHEHTQPPRAPPPCQLRRKQDPTQIHTQPFTPNQKTTQTKTQQGLVVFDIDGQQWSLDLRSGSGSLSKGAPSDKPDITLTMTDANFAQLVAGKLNPQQAFLLRKLKISGSMAMALKLQPILDAAAPKAKM